jgi:hypothetical protein
LNSVPKQFDVQKAAEDVRHRTLAKIPRVLDRFIYLASMRDYNTGIYYHDGLAARFSPDVACEALAGCHQEVYRELLLCPVRDLVTQMEAYIGSSQTRPVDFISTWRRLEPYRVAIPVRTDPFSAELLFSNFRIALAIVEERRVNSARSRQVA